MSKIFIIAGEPSGDLIGAKLISALRAKKPSLQIEGIGGIKMAAEGVKSLFAITDIAVMGFVEIIPKLPLILYRLYQTYRYIVINKPDVLITIDSPGFNLSLVKMLRRKLGGSIKIVNYVAPSVWAYKPERAKVIKRIYDHQLLILPFEVPYFADMAATYVGHPIFEGLTTFESKTFNMPTLAIMPGSRVGEIKQHGLIFAQCCLLLREKIPDLQCIIFTLPSLKKLVKSYFKESYFKIIDSAEEKDRLLSSCTAALVKSGTSSLEVLGHSVPMVIAYKVNPLTAWYIKRKLKIKHVSIANIIANKEVIPELLQDKCQAKLICDKLLPILSDSIQRKQALAEYIDIKNNLSPSGDSASQRAAAVVLKYIV